MNATARMSLDPQTPDTAIDFPFSRHGQRTWATLRRVMLGTIAVVCGFVTPAPAQTSFYEGKTVRLVLGQPAGGGSDVYIRLIAQHLPKHIPGKPNVIVENMIGAGSLVAANYVANVGAQDGSVVAIVGAAIPFSPLLEVKEAKFDPAKLNWMPSPYSDVSGLTLWHTSPVNSIEDARRHELVLASANTFSTSSFYARVMTEVIGIKFKLIYGYNGTAPAFLAMERGEVEGHPSASRAGLKGAHPDWITDKKVKIIVQFGRAPNPEMPGVPFLRDLAKNDADRALVDVAVAPLSIGWPIFMGPGVPADRADIMRKALIATYTDPALRREAERLRIEFDEMPMTGEEVEAVIRNTYAAPEPVLKRLRVLYQGTN